MLPEARPDLWYVKALLLCRPVDGPTAKLARILNIVSRSEETPMSTEAEIQHYKSMEAVAEGVLA